LLKLLTRTSPGRSAPIVRGAVTIRYGFWSPLAGTVLASVLMVEKLEMYGPGPAASAGAAWQTKPAQLAPKSAIASRLREVRRWIRVTTDKGSLSVQGPLSAMAPVRANPFSITKSSRATDTAET
jgi:hypothetical protein